MNTPEVVARRPPNVAEVHVIWMTTGLGCDGDSVSVTAASLPSIEDVVMGNIPGLPKVHLHNPVLAYEVGDDFMDYWFRAAAGKLDPFVLVLEGSVPNESIKKEGYWAAMGTDPDTAQPITTNEWIDRLAPKALAVLACGTCATYGGIHAMEGNPTGAMGLADYLGWGWKSKAGLPIVNVPGCPVQPDNMMETLLYLLYQVAGLAPMIPLDAQLRPTWLFGNTVHDGCDRAGYYEEGDFATEYGSPKCIVKLGCWGPVVNCNVTKRGWMDGLGGCPNVGGICIGCTMPGFPDKFMPFMDEPPGAKVSSGVSSLLGGVVRSLRKITNRTLNKEPRWRHSRSELTTGYTPATTRKTKESIWPPKPPRSPNLRRIGQSRRDVLGSHHPHRRQPRDLHQD
jgi:hydrogenase small subunit